MARASAEPPQERCPICGRPTVATMRPFCSQRCADVDLGRWLTDGYAIPVAEDEAEDGAGQDRIPGHRFED